MKEKLRSLKDNLSVLTHLPKTACLWFSGGSDSRLLLEVLYSTGKAFGIIRQDDGFSKLQKAIIDQVILEKNLQVFSYPPTAYFLIGDGDQLSAVATYPVDRQGNQVPIVRDLVKGEQCAFENTLDVARSCAAPIEFDVHITGTRREDRHYSYGEHAVIQNEKWFVGGKRFYAPLFDWTRAEVNEALETFGVLLETPTDALDTGNIACCSNCLTEKNPFCPKVGKEIEPVDWDKTANLETFRKALNI